MAVTSVAHADDQAAPASPEETFVYENAALGLCYHCFRVRIAVLSDGGVAITRWRVGPRASDQGDPSLSREQVSRARIRRFLQALAPYRPSEEKATIPLLSACSMFVTEAGGLTMIWNDARGYRQLRVDYGCDPARYKAMFDALHHAPGLLGLGDLLNGKW
ncbi:hypothetical protein [Novosphingobium sp.]|uniref:hypothetical protein n=1 Tax=Novosphingobium sp. TaxID=1874826 RepID=UPI0031CFEC83